MRKLALDYVVIQPINGRTDFYDVAAFADLHYAIEWADANTGKSNVWKNRYPLEVWDSEARRYVCPASE